VRIAERGSTVRPPGRVGEALLVGEHAPVRAWTRSASSPASTSRTLRTSSVATGVRDPVRAGEHGTGRVHRVADAQGVEHRFEVEQTHRHGRGEIGDGGRRQRADPEERVDVPRAQRRHRAREVEAGELHVVWLRQAHAASTRWAT
jgi:hypothetical protein